MTNNMTECSFKNTLLDFFYIFLQSLPAYKGFLVSV